jgi:hypothetical protein
MAADCKFAFLKEQLFSRFKELCFIIDITNLLDVMVSNYANL